MRRPPLPALTGARFFAAAWVVAYHLGRPWLVSSTGAARNLLAGAPFAVTIFFVLSGFVLTWVYAGHLDKRAFAAARVARLWPVYALALVLAVPIGLGARRAGLVHDGVSSLLFVATATQAWVPRAALQWDAPLWSLSVEAACYVVFPFILPRVMRARRTTLLVVAAVLWAASVAAGVGYDALDPDHLGVVTVESTGTWLHVLRFNPVVRFPDFFFGMAAARLFLDGGRVPTGALPAAVVVVAGALALGLPVPLVNGSLLTPAAAVVVLALASGSGPAARLLSTKPCQLLGDASYALYALHLPLWMWLAFFTHTKMAETNVVVVAVVALTTSIAVHFALERPLRTLLRAALSSPSGGTPS